MPKEYPIKCPSMDSAEGRMEKKVVVSPCCGDETATYDDRAFFKRNAMPRLLTYRAALRQGFDKVETF